MNKMSQDATVMIYLPGHLPGSRPGDILFPLLAKRGIASSWAATDDPVAAVHNECKLLRDDPVFKPELDAFLNAHPIIALSCESMLAQLALAAGVHWRDTTEVLQPLSRRGWHIGRWLPTFLLVSGPL